MFLWFLYCRCLDMLDIIKEKTKLLHSLTRFSTFYEFFGLKENASPSQIRAAFRALKRKVPPVGMDPKKYEDLVSMGYSILADHADIYRKVLGNSRMYYFDENVQFRSYWYITVLSMILGFVFVDFLVYAIRYLNYTEKYRNIKKDKKAKTAPFNPPVPVSALVFGKIKGVFIK